MELEAFMQQLLGIGNAVLSNLTFEFGLSGPMHLKHVADGSPIESETIDG
jgi:hypothetical protein